MQLKRPKIEKYNAYTYAVCACVHVNYLSACKTESEKSWRSFSKNRLSEASSLVYMEGVQPQCTYCHLCVHGLGMAVNPRCSFVNKII